MLRLLALLLMPLVAFAEPMKLQVQTRVETAPKSGRDHAMLEEKSWDGAKTAVIVCDVWDKHWCPSASDRTAELAPKINEFVEKARAKGAFIIHCPSDCMKFYAGTPQRERTLNCRKHEPKVPLENWCKLDEAREGKLPIDDSNGGCDEDVKSGIVWTRQHPAVSIHADDAVAEGKEVYSLLKEQNRENVIILGVHTNMCILSRSFGIRQLVKQNFNVLLVRDLTDTMYSEKAAPFVSHFTGTDLVVAHIERHWCGSITSDQLLGGAEFRLKADKRPTVAIISSEDEYKTETTLPAFALKHLGKEFRTRLIFADEKDKNRLEGLHQLHNADLLFLSMRRRLLPKVQLEQIRKYVESGKPIVAIRTSSHAFAGKNQKKPEGSAEWLTFDADILGCHYAGHAAHKLGTKIDVVFKGEHPILAGFPADGYQSNSGVYRSSPLAADCTLLLTGTSGDIKSEPVAWVREKAGSRGRVFYAALGHVDDFAQEGFCKILVNACHWATRP